jgi:hypothetical protein
MKSKYNTREEWLNAAVDLLRPIFKARAKVALPKNIRISCGWTSTGRRSSRIGECWSKKSSADGHIEMFISPTLSDLIDVLQVTTHECVHAGVGLEAKHGPIFKAAAHAMGLEGKMKATVAGEAFKAEVAKPILAKLGAYPHGALSGGLSSGPKKQATRLIKVWCPECEYTTRITQKWIDVALPTCPNEECEAHGDAMQVG